VWSEPLEAPLNLGHKLTKLTARTEPTGTESGALDPPAGDTATGSDWVVK
jgi:hypothetical protein